jgi:hypothetical protein
MLYLVSEMLAAQSISTGRWSERLKQATETSVLTTLYAEMRDKPVYVDLNALWRDLGVNSSNKTVSLDDRAPLAEIRRAITLGKPI